jgi:hypothetical protein
MKYKVKKIIALSFYLSIQYNKLPRKYTLYFCALLTKLGYKYILHIKIIYIKKVSMLRFLGVFFVLSTFIAGTAFEMMCSDGFPP